MSRKYRTRKSARLPGRPASKACDPTFEGGAIMVREPAPSDEAHDVVAVEQENRRPSTFETFDDGIQRRVVHLGHGAGAVQAVRKAIQGRGPVGVSDEECVPVRSWRFSLTHRRFQTCKP